MTVGLKALVLILALTSPVEASGSAVPDTPESPLVAAASDLKFALDEIVEQFERETATRVRPTYGSSGNFFQQIAQGAPFEIFLSADEGFVFSLAERGLTIDRGALYAIGRIVLFAPHGSPLMPDEGFDDLAAALADGRVSRFAIANPEHAPYGRAAKEALEDAGLWTAIEPKLVLGENVSQAAQFATSGSAEGGLFALSLALAPSFGKAGTFVVVPEHRHAPLRQRMVRTKKAGSAARAFYEHLREPEARATFERYGFRLPAAATD